MVHQFVATGHVHVAPIIDTIDGDVLSPLRRLKAKYLKRAAYVGALGFDTTYLLTAARDVGALLQPTFVYLGEVEAGLDLSSHAEIDAAQVQVREYLEAGTVEVAGTFISGGCQC